MVNVLLYPMEFIPFLQEMLGITEDFGIVKIEKLETSEKIIRIYLKYLPSTCKVEGSNYSIYDLSPEREWQHLSWFEYKCYIVCKLPRYVDHESKVVTYSPHFAPRGRGYTHLFKQAAINLLQSIRVQSRVASILKTTPYIIRSIMDDAVQEALETRGYVTQFKNISIDEKSYAKGHEYATILMDSDKECIIDMHEGRKEKSVKALFSLVSGEQMQPQLNIVNMDMWQPYMNVIKEIAPQAIIVHDKYHVLSKLSKAIDNTRKTEVYDNEILRKQKYTVLKNEDTRTEKQKEQFKRIEAANLKTAQAWHIKENFKVLWHYINVKDATGIIKEWITKSREKAIYHINLALKTIESHIEGISNAIVTKTTSAIHENNNRKLQEIIANGRGFKTFDRFRINALFYFGNLKFPHYKFS
jgi:transposase